MNRSEGERTYYVYDSGGVRVRKVTERPDGSKAHERIYLGGFEIYREYSRNKIVLERETLHVMDDKRRIALVETKTIDTRRSWMRRPNCASATSSPIIWTRRAWSSTTKRRSSRTKSTTRMGALRMKLFGGTLKRAPSAIGSRVRSGMKKLVSIIVRRDTTPRG